MYLDTKNLTTTNSSSSNAATTTTTTQHSNNKAARGMRKVWQPLRRLLAVGGKGRPLPHPNNVDLNNTQELRVPIEALHLDTDSDSKVETSKSLHSHSVELEYALRPPPNTPTLISSVYVEKASAQSCRACQHGRNCQHAQHSQQLDSHPQQQQPQQQPQQQLLDLQLMEALQLPMQYISTDSGTFFWANSQERIDDDLLHAWLCQSFSQLPGTLC